MCAVRSVPGTKDRNLSSVKPPLASVLINTKCCSMVETGQLVGMEEVAK